jgi:uncharacterized repeat protein (TIGR02543 family)
MKTTTKKMFSFLMAIFMTLSVFTAASAASAADPAIVQGPTVTADPASPTGYTVTFVYYNPNATQVQLCGDLTLLDINTGANTRYQPEAWQLGRYHAGGVEFTRAMTKDADGYWSASIPMHAGGLSYWYRVWDPTQGWSNKRIWDPSGAHPRPAIDPNHVTNSTPYRVKNNDVLGAVYVPLDAAKQNDPTLIGRATYELPVADPAQRGTVQYIPYTTILGGVGYNLGIYLPAGYDANRATPYKVVYLAHGIYGDETDWMIPGNAPNIMDNLIARGEIEPTVLVTMGNQFTGTGNLPSYNQQNAADNLVQVILPLIEANYNVSKTREGRAYGGFSMGGMTGGNVIKTYPTTFGFYGFFSGNPSLTTTNYNNIKTALGTNPLFVFLGNGFFEGSLSATNTIRNNFRNKGFSSETAQVRGAHDMMTAGMLFTIFARDYLWTIDTVKFDLNGGDSAPIADQKLNAGNKVVKPADPSRTGYTFTGWTFNGQEFDFNTPITGGITLVAHWMANTSLSVNAVSGQYSDPFTLQAVVSPVSANGDTATGSVEFFIDGTSVGSNDIDASGTATLSLSGTYAPGSYNITATFTSTNANFTGSSGGPAALTVTQEDAVATYTGDMLAFTASGGSTANVLLRATVLDSDDGYPGDIRNATVTFKEGTTILCGPIVVALINSDTTTGAASCTTSLGLGAHTIDVYVNNYYTGTTSGVVEVAQPNGSFITGGGFLTIGTSGGTYLADSGSRSNFGFNVSYKNMKSFQGHVNIIFRAGGHTYQIKSTAIDSLGIAFKTASGSACSGPVSSTCFGLADFRSKANLTDVTNPLAPISLGGNLTLQVTITDQGEPGSSDTVAFTLWSGNTLIFSSEWNGSKTLEQILGGGNLVVH